MENDFHWHGIAPNNEEAKKALDGSLFEGRNLKVDEARPPRSNQRRNYQRY